MSGFDILFGARHYTLYLMSVMMCPEGAGQRDVTHAGALNRLHHHHHDHASPLNTDTLKR